MFLEFILTSALISTTVIIGQSILGRIKVAQTSNPDSEPNEVNTFTETDLLTSIEFVNRTSDPRKFWIEPLCVEFEPDLNWDFMLVTRDDSYTLEFHPDTTVIWLAHTMGFKLFKRPTSKAIPNPNVWELEEDYSSFV